MIIYSEKSILSEQMSKYWWAFVTDKDFLNVIESNRKSNRKNILLFNYYYYICIYYYYYYISIYYISITFCRIYYIGPIPGPKSFDNHEQGGKLAYWSDHSKTPQHNVTKWLEMHLKWNQKMLYILARWFELYMWYSKTKSCSDFVCNLSFESINFSLIFHACVFRFGCEGGAKYPKKTNLQISP